MALFTEGHITTLEDLSAQDAAILDIASSEGIDLTQKVALAEQEVGIEVTAVLRRLNGGEGLLGTGGLDLGSVVVTPPLKLWHTFRTLELAYRDAYHNQLNDRYKGRRDEYRELARWAAEKLWATGIGLTSDPVPQATTPELAATLGLLPAGTYFVAASWVGATGAEGLVSAAAEFELTGAGAISVNATGAPSNAVKWNVYAGLAADELKLQNPAPLELSEGWLVDSDPSAGGRGPGNGPEATVFRTAPRVLQRG
jgi:hypothetical protein